MIAFWSLLIGTLLLWVLLIVALKGLLIARELEEEPAIAADEQVRVETCPNEVIERIFSSVDWHFISGMKCAGLAALFQRERKLVALLWVRHTGAAIRQVMREHAEAARRSRDLNW